MKAPWADKTGFAKAATILITILLISLGLCGLNFGVFSGLDVIWPRPAFTPPIVADVLIVLAYVETAVIALSAAGLLLLCLIFVGRKILASLPRTK